MTTSRQLLIAGSAALVAATTTAVVFGIRLPSESDAALQQMETLRQEVAALRRAVDGANSAKPKPPESARLNRVQRPSPDAGTHPSGSYLAEVEQRLASFAVRIAALETERPPHSTPPRSPADRAAARENAEALNERRIATLEGEFRRQPANARWASEMLPMLKQSVTMAAKSDPGIRADLLGVECRSIMCRMEVENRDLDSDQHFQLALMLETSRMFPNTISRRFVEADGRVRTVMFMRREVPRAARDR